MAEFLIRTTTNGSKEVGDIIVVKPDGWTWGNKECPPRYIIVKIPSMSVETAKEYEKALTETVYFDVDETDKGRGIVTASRQHRIKPRKYRIKATYVATILSQYGGVITITEANFLDNIITKLN